MTDCSAPWSWYINALIIRLLCKVSKAWHVRTIKILVQVQVCCTKRDEIRATNLNIIHRYHVGEQLDALITWWMFYAFKIPNTICTNWTAWRLTISPHGFESDQRHVVLPWAPTQWKLITRLANAPSIPSACDWPFNRNSLNANKAAWNLALRLDDFWWLL